ncbi:SDR family NAD(P)-dependent oxidoreductase [Sphingomonas crocodyli]|uniref:Glucose 1-dehydrogenase n=1 Tax=Sphingomonas crocodyli TaxID=1979270 RepID=A0A437M9T7_9SPHN|nr:glucose 1-dehydrogenase [Sphingomonas crocodyli]RVT94305.1 glucose 1-dehydrogenase [Sphingomonas crocodyli]
MADVRYDFAGESVVVTGGGRGLGRAIAEGFAAAGATVAIIGRDADRLAQAAADIEGDVRAYAADVADEAAMEAVAARILGDLGPVDTLINNAGINPWYRSAEKVPMSEWRAIIDVNLSAVFHCCLLFGKPMIERGKGSIIGISSVAGHVGLAKAAAYNAAKGGLELLTKSLAIDWAAKGVRVNTVAPGYFETDLTAGLQGHEILSGKIVDHTPLGRFGKPEEVVGACLYLASPAASYVTGQSLRVDGGYTAS